MPRQEQTQSNLYSSVTAANYGSFFLAGQYTQVVIKEISDVVRKGHCGDVCSSDLEGRAFFSVFVKDNAWRMTVCTPFSD